jgi:hypothetical protein
MIYAGSNKRMKYKDNINSGLSFDKQRILNHSQRTLSCSNCSFIGRVHMTLPCRAAAAI